VAGAVKVIAALYGLHWFEAVSVDVGAVVGVLFIVSVVDAADTQPTLVLTLQT
jgi:hypothetical protein